MVEGLLISSFYHGWRIGTERSSNSPEVTQIARSRPDPGTETLQSDFRSILTITLPHLFRLVLYLIQIHKQTQIMYYWESVRFSLLIFSTNLWKILRQVDIVIQLVGLKKKKWDQQAIWCCDCKCRLCLQTDWVWIPAMLIISCVGKLLYLCMSSLFPLL